MSLLRTMPDFDREKDSAVKEVTGRIDSMMFEIARSAGTSPSRRKNLQAIVQTAADISVDLGQQQAHYVFVFDQVGGTFDSETMEDVSQAQVGHGQMVLAIVFPSLKKSVQNGSKVTVVSKAQVLI